jgi:hypothetical protein
MFFKPQELWLGVHFERTLDAACCTMLIFISNLLLKAMGYVVVRYVIFFQCEASKLVYASQCSQRNFGRITALPRR